MTLGNLLVSDASCQDLLGCAFDLKPLERTAYLCLLGTAEHTLDDLAAHLARDRTTVHRAVNKLVSLGLVVKDNRGMEGGGYFQVYRPAAPETVARLVADRFEALQARVKEMVRRFPTEVRETARQVGGKIHAGRRRS